jgi:hypothetical protein
MGRRTAISVASQLRKARMNCQAELVERAAPSALIKARHPGGSMTA